MKKISKKIRFLIGFFCLTLLGSNLAQASVNDWIQSIDPYTIVKTKEMDQKISELYQALFSEKTGQETNTSKQIEHILKNSGFILNQKISKTIGRGYAEIFKRHLQRAQDASQGIKPGEHSYRSNNALFEHDTEMALEEAGTALLRIQDIAKKLQNLYLHHQFYKYVSKEALDAFEVLRKKHLTNVKIRICQSALSTEDKTQIKTLEALELNQNELDLDQQEVQAVSSRLR